MHIKIAKAYELKYWKAHCKKVQDRSRRMVELFSLPSVSIAADVGCGPRCGIFQNYESDVMYAVDPLWPSYKKEKLCNIPERVEVIEGCAETFELPRLADVIVSVNALDHSGSLKESIRNIMSNIKPSGLFCFHIHMRTKKQLNKGHRMLVSESSIDDICSEWTVENKQVYPNCPIEDKPYKSYVATVRNQR